MDFTPGQTAIWLSRLLGTYGPDIVNGRNVAMMEVQVVRIGPKRVQVQVVSTHHGRLVWVNPSSLRRTDDPVIVHALEKRKQWGKT
jgi:hypothetical protein